MPRPKASARQQLLAYDKYKEGLGPSAIYEALVDKFEEDTVSLRTLSTWVKGFRTLEPEIEDLDSPFQWHRLEEYGLPWEAGAYLLDMQADMTEYWASVQPGLDEPARPHTVRRVVWWWRVHLAVPDATNYLDIYLWAEYFVKYELIRDVLGESIDLAGIEAYLAYAPWRSSSRLNRYLRAVDEERIPRGPDVWGEYLLVKRAREATGVDNLVDYVEVSFDRPEVLPSKAFGEYLGESLEKNRRLEAREREVEARERELEAKRRVEAWRGE